MRKVWQPLLSLLPCWGNVGRRGVSSSALVTGWGVQKRNLKELSFLVPFPLAVPHLGRWQPWSLQWDCFARCHCRPLPPRMIGIEFYPEFRTLWKAPIYSEREKGGWLISVISCKIIQGATEEANYTWSLMIWWARAGCTSWYWLPMGTAVARSFGNFQRRVLAPGGAHVFSSPLSAAVFRRRSKNSHWGIPWKLPERLLCCSPRSLLQNV